MRHILLMAFLLSSMSCARVTHADAQTARGADANAIDFRSKDFETIVGDLYYYTERNKQSIKIGMSWGVVRDLLQQAGWTDLLIAFQLEGGFAKLGGRMYGYQNTNSTILYFGTIPYNGREVLIVMYPAGSESLGAEVKIIEFLAW